MRGIFSNLEMDPKNKKCYPKFQTRYYKIYAYLEKLISREDSCCKIQLENHCLKKSALVFTLVK